MHIDPTTLFLTPWAVATVYGCAMVSVAVAAVVFVQAGGFS